MLDKYIDLAYNMFEDDYDSSRYRTYHYAFLVRRNKILSVGKNEYQTPKGDIVTKYFGVPHYGKYKCLHAETDAIIKIWGRKLIKPRDKIIVVRVGLDGVQNSRPCKNCRQIISSLQLKDYYTCKS